MAGADALVEPSSAPELVPQHTEVNPPAEAPTAEVPQQTVVTPVFEKRLLEAECSSLRSALLEEQKGVNPVVIYSPDLESDDPVKEQLKFGELAECYACHFGGATKEHEGVHASGKARRNCDEDPE